MIATKDNDKELFFRRACEELENGYYDEQTWEKARRSALHDDDIEAWYIKFRADQMEKHNKVFPSGYPAVNDELSPYDQPLKYGIRNITLAEKFVLIAVLAYLAYTFWEGVLKELFI